MLTYIELVNLVHVLIVGPLLIYVGYYKSKVPSEVFTAVLVLGVVVVVYHLYKLGLSQYNKRNSVKVV